MEKILRFGFPIIKKQIDHMISDNSNNINIYGVAPKNFIKQGNMKNNNAYKTNIQVPIFNNNSNSPFFNVVTL